MRTKRNKKLPKLSDEDWKLGYKHQLWKKNPVTEKWEFTETYMEYEKQMLEQEEQQ